MDLGVIVGGIGILVLASVGGVADVWPAQRAYLRQIAGWRFAPDRLFLWLGFFVGCLFVALIPPFQVPDEPHHLLRTYQISTGQFAAIKQDDLSGGYVPASLQHAAVVALGDVPFNPDVKLTPEQLQHALAIPLAPHHQPFADFRQVALYAPVAYAPQALAVALGRQFELPLIILLYMGRTAAMIASVLLVFVAIRVTPIFKWFFFAYAFLPVAVFLRSSLSADNLTNSIALLVIAACLRCALAPDEPRRTRDLLLLAGVSVLLALSKQTYFLLPLLFLLIPVHALGSWQRYVLWFIAIMAASVAALGIWTAIALAIFAPVPAIIPSTSEHLAVAFDPTVQTSTLLSAPLHFVRALFGSFEARADTYLTEFLGFLGWLDTLLPWWFRAFFLAFLIAVAVWDGDAGIGLSLRKRLIVGLVAAASVLLIFAINYVMWNTPDNEIIWGVQGRYFIPIAPVLFLLLYNQRLRLTAWMRVGVVIACAGSSLYTLWVVVDRYYG